MTRKENLLRIISDPAEIAAVYAEVAGKMPGFPHSCCAAVCSTFLRKAGLNVAYQVNAQSLADWLERDGHIIPHFTRVDRYRIKRGDIVVTVDGNDTPGADHIFIATDDYRRGSNRIWCADNNLIAPQYSHRQRNVDDGDETLSKTPVNYGLAWPGE